MCSGRRMLGWPRGALLALFVLASCYDGTYSTKSGREFDYEKATLIKEGTSRANVVAVLGTLASVRRMPDGTEQIEYAYVMERSSGVHVGARVPTNHQQCRRRAVFVIRNGRVAKSDVSDQLL